MTYTYLVATKPVSQEGSIDPRSWWPVSAKNPTEALYRAVGRHTGALPAVALCREPGSCGLVVEMMTIQEGS